MYILISNTTFYVYYLFLPMNQLKKKQSKVYGYLHKKVHKLRFICILIKWSICYTYTTKSEGCSLYDSIVTSLKTPFPTFFLNACKTLNFTQIVDWKKACTSVEQDEIEKISCVDRRWKIYLNTNLLDPWAGCLLKEKPTKFTHF
jgi:hypothetical protein